MHNLTRFLFLFNKMKFTPKILFFVIFQWITTYSYAQEKIILSVKDATLEQVIRIIEQQTDYLFFYNLEDINPNIRISLNIKSSDITDILKKLSRETKILYRVKDRHIILTSKEEPILSRSISQKKKISGIITDLYNEPLVGVNIVEKGTLYGTITNSEGKFTMLTSHNATLEISYIGYETQTLKVHNQSLVNIRLKEDLNFLNEIIVVAYGVQKKSDLTGSVASVKANVLPSSATSSVENMMAGKIAGMQVTSNDAQPGGALSFVIRGKGSVEASNNPLFVIDGYPISGAIDSNIGGRYQVGERSPLNTINPNDIESIEVLKDASSTAIYGARASNGVILITTKSGKKGRPRVTYDMKYAVQSITNKWALHDASSWYQLRNRYDYERYLIDGGYAPFGDKIAPDDFKPTYTDDQITAVGKGTDWVDKISQTGVIEEHNISISGATETANYMASFNYYDQSGIFKNNDLNRYAIRLNVSQNIRSWLKAGVHATGSKVKYDNPTLGTGLYENAGILEAARVFSPDLPVYDEKGKYTHIANAAGYPNPVSLLEISNETTQDRILAQAYIEIIPFKDLLLKAQFGYDKQTAKVEFYLPRTTLYGEKEGGYGTINQSQLEDKLLSYTANYKKTFKEKHRFDLLLGYEWQITNRRSQDMNVSSFPSDSSGTNGMGDGKGRPVIDSSRSLVEFASYFGRVNYAFNDKYLFTFSLRTDGSDKFGANNRWGWFPSGAFAWRINEEDFMQNQSVISNAKLRISVGETGNSTFSGSAFGYYTHNGDRDYIFGNNLNAGAFQENHSNPDLKWETTREYNIGFDLGLYNNRINVTFDYFSRSITDLIGKRKLLYYLPGNEMYANIGKSSSKGFDLSIQTVNLKGPLYWTSILNLSAYRDKWKKRNSDVALGPHESQNDYIRVHWGYVLDGILQPGEKLSYGDYPAGSQKVKDIAGIDQNGKKVMKPDGIINDADMVVLARQDPDLIVGFTNTFEYKNFDLNIHLYGFLGWMKRNEWLFRAKDMNNKIEAGYNYPTIDLKDYWSSSNPTGKYPNIFTNIGEPANEQYMMEKADFIRVKNITLGYTFSELRSLKKYLDKARVFVDISNPFLITKFTQIDPEYNTSYPTSRMITFGLNIEF